MAIGKGGPYSNLEVFQSGDNGSTVDGPGNSGWWSATDGTGKDDGVALLDV